MKTNHLFCLALLVTLLVMPFSHAASGKNDALVAQWEVADLSFMANETPSAPFEVGFEARFTGPGGTSLTVPGFYNGGREWMLRFSHGMQGKWSFSTRSDLASLNGLTGSLTIMGNKDPKQHGGIKINPDRPQHFIHEDGTPYHSMAFECDWLFALDYAGSMETPKTRHLMDLLEQDGFNQIVTTLYSFDVNWKKDPKLNDHPEHEYGGNLAIYPFGGTNKDPDFSTLNVEFFKKFDRCVALMNEHHIVAHLMIYVWNKQVNWPGPRTTEDNRYFDYVIKRYQAFPNVIWDVSKEALNNARCTEEYGRERIERIRNLDAFKRLVTVHDYGFCQRNTDVVDFISIQTWSGSIYNAMLEIHQKYPEKPLFNIEHGGYERSFYDVFPGDYIDPKVCLRRNWLCSFAGAYNTYYWQGAAWNVIIHNPFQQPLDFPEPRFDYYRHMTDFFTRFPYSEFSPAPERNHSAYCLQGGNIYLFFIPREHYQLSAYGGPLRQKTGTVQWFNCFTGEYSEELPCTDGFFVSPWQGEADSVLIRKL